MKYLIVILVLCVTASCQGTNGGQGANVQKSDINDVLKANTPAIMALDGVTAVGIGALDDGTPSINVYVVKKTDEIIGKIPAELDGHPVVIIESGVIEALPGEDS